jgi:uncharacterized protein (UPF0332 family)
VHFIRPGRIETHWSRVVARLQKYREEADYGGVFVLDQEALAEELESAASLCARARVLVERASPDAT